MYWKFMTIQILLLCAGIKCYVRQFGTFVSDRVKGGFYDPLEPRNYIVDENQTIEIFKEWIGDGLTNYTYEMPDGDPSQPNITWTKIFEDDSYNCTVVLRLFAHRNMTSLIWNVTDPPDIHSTEYALQFIVVQYAQAPEIVLVDSDRRSPNDDDPYIYLENEELFLRCVGEGIVNYTLTWVDSNGDPVESSEVIEIGPQTRNTSFGRYVVQPTSRDLNLTVQKEMTSFGCRMVSTSFQSGYDVTTWFNMTVLSKPNATLFVDKSTCDQVTFHCLHNQDTSERVKFDFNFYCNTRIV